MLFSLPEVLLPILVDEANQKIIDVGGPEAWAILSKMQEITHDTSVYQEICL